MKVVENVAIHCMII